MCFVDVWRFHRTLRDDVAMKQSLDGECFFSNCPSREHQLRTDELLNPSADGKDTTKLTCPPSVIRDSVDFSDPDRDSAQFYDLLATRVTNARKPGDDVTLCDSETEESCGFERTIRFDDTTAPRLLGYVDKDTTVTGEEFVAGEVDEDDTICGTDVFNLFDPEDLPAKTFSNPGLTDLVVNRLSFLEEKDGILKDVREHLPPHSDYVVDVQWEILAAEIESNTEEFVKSIIWGFNNQECCTGTCPATTDERGFDGFAVFYSKLAEDLQINGGPFPSVNLQSCCLDFESFEEDPRGNLFLWIGKIGHTEGVIKVRGQSFVRKRDEDTSPFFLCSSLSDPDNLGCPEGRRLAAVSSNTTEVARSESRQLQQNGNVPWDTPKINRGGEQSEANHMKGKKQRKHKKQN
mmetsp:Transcript_27670/g.68991  ORF Transcript_27670/g.68991 Transcript_27670/m.68991 type:complete len:405 (-) Transcript_27670:1572-2786(-)